MTEKIHFHDSKDSQKQFDDLMKIGRPKHHLDLESGNTNVQEAIEHSFISKDARQLEILSLHPKRAMDRASPY